MDVFLQALAPLSFFGDELPMGHGRSQAARTLNVLFIQSHCTRRLLCNCNPDMGSPEKCYHNINLAAHQSTWQIPAASRTKPFCLAHAQQLFLNQALVLAEP
eukprot:TRINITY_DN8887_c0_g6_i1.p2 TRINITY_DN8887_c0_g6~~TRINITY_DN8887_c0_g6_i1.p2  ORF type:complete len:102 (+),score=8.14 TRINITY_DN8887_c0_g6_i1:201-506(+)